MLWGLLKGRERNRRDSCACALALRKFPRFHAPASGAGAHPQGRARPSRRPRRLRNLHPDSVGPRLGRSGRSDGRGEANTPPPMTATKRHKKSYGLPPVSGCPCKSWLHPGICLVHSPKFWLRLDRLLCRWMQINDWRMITTPSRGNKVFPHCAHDRSRIALVHATLSATCRAPLVSSPE